MSTREQILDVATRLLQEKGAAHATTQGIANEVGLSEGALYKHFAREEEIFLSILHRRLPAFVAALDSYQPGTGSVQGNLPEELAQERVAKQGEFAIVSGDALNADDVRRAESVCGERRQVAAPHLFPRYT